MPLVPSTDIDWRRAFIRSGVRFVDRREMLDLSIASKATKPTAALLSLFVP